MTRRIRMFEPDRFYFITNRTMQGRLLMTPTPRVRDLVGGVLGRSLYMHEVELFAYVFMSNHFHLIIRAKAGELAKFMGHLQGNIAREIGAKVDWRGKFWQRRYSAEALLDEESYIDKLGYIFAHGVKEGLVEKSQKWPGLTCIPEITHGLKRLFPWVDRTQIYQARGRGQKLSEEQVTTRYRIDVSVPHFWKKMKEEQRQKKMRIILQDWERRALESRASKNPLGVKQIKAQHPHQRPKESKRSAEPLCHAASTLQRKSYEAVYRNFVLAYRRASRLFRIGKFDTKFPQYSYRPPPRYGLDD